MIKLYLHLHTANSNFKKQFLTVPVLLFALLFTGFQVCAQCLPAPVVNAVANQVVCNNAAITTINFTGTATSYTWTNTAPSIGLAASGSGNINSFTAVNTTAAAITATISVTPVSGACTGTSISFTITVNPSPLVTVTPVTSCGGLPGVGGPCNPLTASGADSYVWSPVTGLYTDCTAAVPYTGTNVATVYAAPLTNSVYTVTGIRTATGCTASAIATVKATPPAPVVTPAAVFMCLNDPPAKLKIASPNSTAQFCSGTVNIPVPDNNAAGASSSIAVSGIPATCIITGITVNINMAHTRVGDMVFVLRGPNGNIINLDYRMTATGGSGITTGFTNTAISSVATVPLSTGTNPYSGVFKADAQLTATGTLGTPGPTGMQPNIANWAGLFSTANGNWTLGFYDAATGETGTLSFWCLNIAYTCGSGVTTSPAVWSPIVGLYSDPAALVPYPGIAVDSLWVKPLPAGTYTYQVTNQSLPLPGCVSAPRSVVVTVGTLISITAQPVNQNICLGNDAHFTVAAATGTGLTYQWQTSTNGGVTFINLVNGGFFSGVTTAALTITAPPVSMNNSYYRVIINGSGACGAVISNIGILTVNPLPVVVISASPYYKLLPGLTTTISSTVAPNPAASYSWLYNGSVIPGATADTIVVDFTGVGFYQLSVTDVKGCTNLSNTIEIKDSLHGRIFIYPNPGLGQFQVRFYSEPNTVAARTLIVYDNMGNRIITKSYNQTIPYQRMDIDIRAHGKGLYTVEVLDQGGTRIGLSRVLVQ